MFVFFVDHIEDLQARKVIQTKRQAKKAPKVPGQ